MTTQGEFWSDTGPTRDDGETLPRFLPTPNTVNRTSNKAKFHRPTSGPHRGGPSYGLLDVVEAGMSISFAVASRASPSPSPASERATPMTDGSGPRCVEFARYSDPDGCWLKTCQGSCQLLLDGSSERWSETWPRSGTLLNGIAYRRQPLVPRISEIASSSWPTPDTMNHIDGTKTRRDRLNRPDQDSRHAVSLHHAVHLPHLYPRRWPTPQSADATRHGGDYAKAARGAGGDDLSTVVKRWPTPAARDWRSDSSPMTDEELYGKKGKPLPRAVGGQLNPTWVEWLMGFPRYWTVLEAYPPSPRFRAKRQDEPTDSKVLATPLSPR